MFDRSRQTLDKAHGVSLACQQDVNRPVVGDGEESTWISSEVTTKLTYSGQPRPCFSLRSACNVAAVLLSSD